MNDSGNHAGHRKRLRQRFLKKPKGITDEQLLELILTYAIPRQDMVPVAAALIDKFGSLAKIFSATREELTSVSGLGDAAATLILTFRDLQQRLGQDSETVVEKEEKPSLQPSLFPKEEELIEEAKAYSPKPPPPPPTKADIRTYTNDLSQVALDFLPKANDFPDLASFIDYLENNLPYNSGVTRNRYAKYLTNRFFPGGDFSTPLKDYLASNSDISSIKMGLFYETVRNEPAVKYVAEEAIWPALPAGGISRDDLKKQLQVRFAEASEATIKRMVYSVARLYTILGVAQESKKILRLATRPGTLESFAYVLAAQFPEPGIYPFEAIERGSMRYWLLWDRDWMRRQLYNLRDLDILAKVSEIDSYRQFTIQYGSTDSLARFYAHPERQEMALCERDVVEEDDMGRGTAP